MAYNFLTQAAGDARYVAAPGSFGAAGSMSAIDQGDTANAGVATSYARIDHQHALNIHGLTVCTSGTRPSSPTAGDLIFETDTARKYIYDGTQWRFIGGKAPSVQLTRSTAQSVNNTTITDLTWDTETWDTDAFHSGSNATIVVPTGLGGLFLVEYNIEFSSHANGNSAWLVPSGTLTNRQANLDLIETQGTNTQVLAGSALLRMAATDTVKVSVFQNSGGALNVTDATSYFRATLLPVWF